MLMLVKRRSRPAGGSESQYDDQDQTGTIFGQSPRRTRTAIGSSLAAWQLRACVWLLGRYIMLCRRSLTVNCNLEIDRRSLSALLLRRIRLYVY
jgi:hypothetical protein